MLEVLVVLEVLVLEVLVVLKVLVVLDVLVLEVLVVLGQPAAPSSPAQGCMQRHT